MDTRRLAFNEQATAMSGGEREIRTGRAYPANIAAVHPAAGAGPYTSQQGTCVKTAFVNPAGPVADGAGAGEHEPEPPAPTPDSMEQLPGYGNIGFEEVALPPPTCDEAVRDPPPDRQAVNSVAAISDQEAREAIMQHVNEHCCYGKGPAQEMQFTELKASNAFHYTLETFGESRSRKWVSKPYMGEGIVVSGPPPGLWDIQLQAPQMFATSKQEVEVPNTASVKPCYNCHARGYKRCTFCFGIGRVHPSCAMPVDVGGHGSPFHPISSVVDQRRVPVSTMPRGQVIQRLCTRCGGNGFEIYYDNGQQYTRSCTWCIGGYSRCTFCGGTGRVTCTKCHGSGNLRWCIMLAVQWTNHLDDYIVERTALPDKLIRTVRGQTAFEETGYPRVWPVNDFTEQEINAASNNLVSRHARYFTTERILVQRHRVRIIPVTEVFYNYKQQQHSKFFVYGVEHKVYAPNYPAKCCWGCTVL